MPAIAQIISSALASYAQLEASADPLALRAAATIAAITLYAIFAGSFYETLSKRSIFKLNLPKPLLFSDEERHVRLWDVFVLFLQYTIAFPVITVIWTLALTLFLLALSSASPAQVAVLSLSIVAATRIISYYDEHIAVDIAKLLPLALLALIIANPASLSPQQVYAKVQILMQNARDFVPLFLFMMAVEWALRLCLELKYFIFGRPNEEDTALDKLLAHYRPPKSNK